MAAAGVTFLGTGTSQGVPLIACTCRVCKSTDTKDKRLRSSVLISNGTDNFVIDTGPDFRQQMLRENIKDISAVLFTHEHKDHTAGLDDIRAFNFIQQKHIDVYATERVQMALKREFSYIFEETKYPGVPLINMHTIHPVAFTIAGTTFLPIEVMHYQLPVLGFRVGNFTYITDGKTISDKEKKKIAGTGILVLNALRRTEHISHFTLEEALALIRELNPGKAYLTHISHQLGMHHEIEKELPPNVFLAYDGLQIPFNPDASPAEPVP